MAKLGAQEGAPLKVVNDQRGNPTSTKAVAEAVRFVLSKPSLRGVVHATCEGEATWYELALELKKLLGDRFPRGIVPCTTEEFPRPAPRPRNSALAKDVLGAHGWRMPDWRAALAEFVAQEFSS
jgi:dTDP-4-dehydrorhamnose reductase